MIEGSPEAQTHAAATVWNLAVNNQNEDVIREEGGVQALIKVLLEGSQEAQANAAGALRNLAMSKQNKDVTGMGQINPQG